MESKKPREKILITAGGTGGHLFPAQALAKQLLKEWELLFVGEGLSSNRCFQQDLFPFQEISSATLFHRSVHKLPKALAKMIKGIQQSFKILKQFKPDLIIGFGSFYSFPILVAALCRGVPFVLFEPDSEPGKVNRLFSRWAVLTAVPFSKAASRLKGKTVEVHMPIWEREEKEVVSVEEARAYFGLHPLKTTLLVFGGSQGSSSINTLFCEAVQWLGEEKKEVQIIHLTGKHTDLDPVRSLYARLGYLSCVKEFEDRMSLAWRAASVVICRAGAATLAEMMAFEVPGILIPYPQAAGDHQRKNAEFMQREIGGAIHFLESELNASKLYAALLGLIDPDKGELFRLRASMQAFKKKENKEDLTLLISKVLNG